MSLKHVFAIARVIQASRIIAIICLALSMASALTFVRVIWKIFQSPSLWQVFLLAIFLVIASFAYSAFRCLWYGPYGKSSKPTDDQPKKAGKTFFTRELQGDERYYR